MANDRKLIEDLEAKATSFDARAAGYRMAGTRNLARQFAHAAMASRLLADNLKALDLAEGRARAGIAAVDEVAA